MNDIKGGLILPDSGILSGGYTCSYCGAYVPSFNLSGHNCISSQPAVHIKYSSKSITIEKAENGYVVNKDGKKFVVDCKEKLLEFIE